MEELTEKAKKYYEVLKAAKPKKLVEKYSLNENAITLHHGMDGTTYYYQRCRVPEDKRYSIAYGKLDQGKAINWFYWYDEVIIVLAGKARFITSTRPTFDREEVHEVDPTEMLFISKGVKCRWESVGDEPLIYIIVAMPAAAKD